MCGVTFFFVILSIHERKIHVSVGIHEFTDKFFNFQEFTSDIFSFHESRTKLFSRIHQRIFSFSRIHKRKKANSYVAERRWGGGRAHMPNHTQSHPHAPRPPAMLVKDINLTRVKDALVL